MARKIGMWMYTNGGGDKIQETIISKLQEREIETLNDLNLRNSIAKNGKIFCGDVVMEELDLYFTYNAGEQTQYQVYLYETLDYSIPIINTFKSFSISEDKFKTAHILSQNGVSSTSYKLCHRDDTKNLKKIIKKWGGKMVYKPVDGWGGVGLVKIENEANLDMLLPFLNQMDLRFFYVEKFIDYDNTDFRIDIVDGKFISCYGRKAPENDWKTNITSGGSIILREPDDAVVNTALKAVEVTGLDIAGVDLVYDREKEEYVVLEVNGIPAFATPEQEAMGLNFNDKKIEAIVELIDKKTKEGRYE